MMLKLTIIALLLCGTVGAFSIGGYKGSSKKFTLRTAKEDSSLASLAMSRSVSRSAFAQREGGRQRSRKPDNHDFPEELRYVMNLEGKGDVELHLVRDRSVRVPKSYSRGKAGQSESHTLNTEKIAFYKEMNGHGSFACELTHTTNGQSECSITALLDMGEENCYLIAGADTLDCSSKENGKPMFFSEPKIDPTIKLLNRTESRQKRNILPEPGFRSVEVAYLPDAKFTDLFYRRHPGDTVAAETEMDLFFTLLTNEINVFYSTVPETSSFNLRLQLYAATVAYPGYQQNFPWSENNNDGTYLYYTNALDTNLEFIINDSGFITGQYDFVFAITGFNLRDATSGNPLVSFTYQSVMCTTSRKKYSLTEFTAFNLPRILAHELGHALGARHDDDTACPANVNIMSMNMFNPDNTSKDTFYKFSTCSTDDMIDQIYTVIPFCLLDDAYAFEQFIVQFCTGFAGSQAGYLDKQCERVTNVVGSTACDSVNATACYARNTIRCTDSQGQCGTQKLQYVWNGTPCGTDKICYQGSCVDTFAVCSTTTTTTTAAPTTTTTAAPTTTTTAAPTTSTTTTTAAPTTTTTTAAPTTTTTTAAPTTTTTTTAAPTTTTTTAAPTTTTTAPTTTTTTPPLSCSCCGLKRNKRRERCCRRGLAKDGIECYCCGSIRWKKPPAGWTGNTY